MDRKILARRQLRYVTILQDYPKSVWGKKAPALTVAQLRRVLAVILPLRTPTIEEILAYVAWVQRRNHGAYLAHRKRRETEG